MPSLRPLRFVHRLRLGGSLLATGLLLAGCATSPNASLPPANLPQASPEPLTPPAAHPPSDPELVPVVRYGRYTLVELAPAAAQRDLLLQVVDISVPDTLHATVGDALRYLLLRSGYEACVHGDTAALHALPLPAAHYRLGPLVLRDALLTLAGPAWDMEVNDGTRRICFVRARPATPSVPDVDTPTGQAAETFPIATEARP